MAELADAPDVGSGGLPVQFRPLLPAPEKVLVERQGLFQRNPPLRVGEILLRNVKSSLRSGEFNFT